MRNAPFEVQPIAGALGAEIRGVDLAEDLPDATVGAIRQALLDHLVIFFRDQDLPPERSWRSPAASASRSSIRSSRGSTGFPEIIAGAQARARDGQFRRHLALRHAYLDEPPMATHAVRARGAAARRRHAVRQPCISPTRRCRTALQRLLDGLTRRSTARPRPTSRSTREDRIKDRRQRRGEQGCWPPSIRWCARIPRPAARRSTSTARTPSRFKA